MTTPRCCQYACIGLLVAVTPSGLCAEGRGERPSKDAHGDPLPSGAVARLGSMRLRHAGAKQVQFVLDGKAILSGNGNDGLVRLWDVTSGAELRRFRGGSFYLASDRKTLVTWDEAFRVWDLMTGKESAASPLGSTRPFWAVNVAVTPDAGRLVVAGDLGNVTHGVTSVARVETWDLKTGKLAGQWLEHNRNTFPGILLSPDACMVHFYGGGLRDTATGKPLHKGRLLHTPFFSPDARILIERKERRDARPSEHYSFNLLGFDIGSGKELFQVPGGEYGFYCANGRRFAVGGFPRDQSKGERPSVSIFEASTGKLVRTISDIVNLGPIASLSPDGRLLVCPDWGQIRIWDVDKGVKLREIACRLDQSARTDISPDGRVLAAAVLPGVRLWDIASGERLARQQAHDAVPCSLTFAADGTTLASMDADAVTHVWDTRTGRQRERFEPIPIAPRAFDALPDKYPLKEPMLISGPRNRWFAIGQSSQVWAGDSGFSHSMVHLADLSARAHARSFGSHVSPVGSYAVSADGRALAGCAGKTIRLWDVASGKERLTIPWQGAFDPIVVKQFGPPAPPVLAFSPDGRLLAAHGYRSGTDGKQVASITLWETSGGAERHRFDWAVEPLSWAQAPRGPVALFDRIDSALAVAPDNRTLALVGGPETIRLWDVVTNQELRRVGGPVLADGAAFSPDTRFLATLTKVGDLCLWDVGTGTIVRLLKGPARFTCFRFSPDGRTLATGSEDTTILLWDLKQLATAPAAPRKAAVEQFWTDLAQRDGARAGRAILGLRARGPESVAFLKERLRPVAPADPKKLRQLLAALESPRFADRDRATRDLLKLGDVALAALRQTALEKMTLEGRRRAEQLAEQLAGPITDPETLRSLRAVEVLEQVGSAQAQAVLEELARGMPEHRVTAAARASAARLRVRKSPE